MPSSDDSFNDSYNDMLPTTPHTPPSSTLPLNASALLTPPDSFRKYSDDLRRAMSAGFKAAMRDRHTDAMESHHLDVDYGFDENPFDTRARLLLSFGADEPHATILPTPQATLRKRLPVPTGFGSGLNKHQLEDLEQTGKKEPDFFDYQMDSPTRPPIARPALLHLNRSSCMSRSSTRSSRSGLHSNSFGDMDTPNSDLSITSESSFEASRPDDYVALYGHPPPVNYLSRSPPPPTSLERLSTISAATVRPSPAPATTVPLPAKRPGSSRRRTRSRPYPELREKDEEYMFGRTTSEAMVLTAGLISQQGRVRR